MVQGEAAVLPGPAGQADCPGGQDPRGSGPHQGLPHTLHKHLVSVRVSVATRLETKNPN